MNLRQNPLLLPSDPVSSFPDITMVQLSSRTTSWGHCAGVNVKPRLSETVHLEEEMLSIKSKSYLNLSVLNHQLPLINQGPEMLINHARL